MHSFTSNLKIYLMNCVFGPNIYLRSYLLAHVNLQYRRIFPRAQALAERDRPNATRNVFSSSTNSSKLVISPDFNRFSTRSGDAKGRACRARYDHTIVFKVFSVSVTNVFSPFLAKTQRLNGFIFPASLLCPTLLTPCAETVDRNAHV